MLAIIKTVVLCTLVVVHVYQESPHGVIEVFPLERHIRANQDFVILGDVCSLDELITNLQANMIHWPQRHVVIQHRVAHHFPEVI